MSRQAQRILEIVRGERPLHELAAAGIEIRQNGNSQELYNPNGIVVMPDVVDVAKGLLAFRFEPETLRTWASLVLSGSAFIDLTALDSTSLGEILLNALWDASFSGSVSLEAFEAARELTA